MKLTRFILSMVLLFIFSQCSNRGNKAFSSADSLVIDYYASGVNTSTQIVTAEKKAIKKMAGFINEKERKIYNCGHEGELRFYKEGKLTADVLFFYSNSNCRHFLWRKDGKLVGTEMNDEAASFLEALLQGKSWY